MKIKNPFINIALHAVICGNIITCASNVENISTVTNKAQVKNSSDAALRYDYELGYKLLQQIRNSENLKAGKLPKGINKVALVVYIPDCLKDKISKNVLQELMEYELRKNSVKVAETGQCILVYEIDAFELDDKNQYVYTEKLSLLTQSDFTLDGEKMYTVSSPIWTTSIYGILGKQNPEQKKFGSDLTEMMARFCNKILETREK